MTLSDSPDLQFATLNQITVELHKRFPGGVVIAVVEADGGTIVSVRGSQAAKIGLAEMIKAAETPAFTMDTDVEGK